MIFLISSNFLVYTPISLRWIPKMPRKMHLRHPICFFLILGIYLYRFFFGGGGNGWLTTGFPFWRFFSKRCKNPGYKFYLPQNLGLVEGDFLWIIPHDNFFPAQKNHWMCFFWVISLPFREVMVGSLFPVHIMAEIAYPSNKLTQTNSSTTRS